MTASPLAAALTALLGADEQRVLVTTTGLRAAGLDSVAAAHPTRTIHCGRAEQTAVLVALGLAAEGRRPILTLHAAAGTARARAILSAAAGDPPPDLLVVITGAPPHGETHWGAAPRMAADEQDGAAAVQTLAGDPGVRVLWVPVARGAP